QAGALLGCLRRRDPALDAQDLRELRRRQRLGARLRPRRGDPAVRAADRRGRPRPPLLQHEPGRPHHRGLPPPRPRRLSAAQAGLRAITSTPPTTIAVPRSWIAPTGSSSSSQPSRMVEAGPIEPVSDTGPAPRRRIASDTSHTGATVLTTAIASDRPY